MYRDEKSVNIKFSALQTKDLRFCTLLYALVFLYSLLFHVPQGVCSSLAACYNSLHCLCFGILGSGFNRSSIYIIYIFYQREDTAIAKRQSFALYAQRYSLSIAWNVEAWCQEIETRGC